MGGPQLRLGASTGTSCRREIITGHGHILVMATSCKTSQGPATWAGQVKFHNWRF
jgi:hypothetical protein